MNKRLTDEELQAIRERAEKATGAEWIRFEDGIISAITDEEILFEIVVREVESYNRVNDGHFIAHARQDIPKLLAEIDRLNRLYCELKEIAHNIEVDRNETAAEYREYYEKSEAEIERLKIENETLRDVAKNQEVGSCECEYDYGDVGFGGFAL